jgi:hypothetical protein
MAFNDSNYITMQFWNKIFQKNATEFQTFFENIMERAFDDFHKVRPYGNKGDGGNDGYIPSKGIYYQVYAPKNPNEKESTAAKKLKDDFDKLKKNWDQISKIKEYNFVFNDKGTGASIEIEKALANLRELEPDINFVLFTPKRLEKIFMLLENTDLVQLGFDDDMTNSVSLAKETLENLDSLLDWNNAESVIYTLDAFQNSLQKLDNEKININYELVKARALQKLERIPEVRQIYESLCKRYPDDSAAFLYLAELHLLSGEIEKCQDLVAIAEKINDDNWLLSYMKLALKYQTGEDISTESITESSFPQNPRVRSNFCRLYALIFERGGNRQKADSFIEKAIHYNERKFKNYDIKLSLLEARIDVNDSNNDTLSRQQARAYLDEIKQVKVKEDEWGSLPYKDNALLNVRIINALEILEDYVSMEEIFKDIFDLLLKCYFDDLADRLFVRLLSAANLPDIDIRKLQQYLTKSEKVISANLAKTILFQFSFKDQLLSNAKEFFEELGIQDIVEFLINIEKEQYDDATKYILQDIVFAINMANTLKSLPDLRKKIIAQLPERDKIQKDKLLFLLYYDEKDYDKAFELLKTMDLQDLNYFECARFLEVASIKHAWDFEITLINNLLQFEKNEKSKLRFRIQLMNAFNNLEKYLDGIEIAEEILADEKQLDYLDITNKERLLGQTINMRMKRGEYEEAKLLIDKNRNLINTFEFKIGLEADVYLKNNDVDLAILAIVDGIKKIKTPSPEEYGSLFFVFTQIGNMIEFPLTSSDKVVQNSFVKFSEQDRWYFVGNDEELDASKIPTNDEKYLVLLDKSVGDSIEFINKYRSNTCYTIELIMPIEKYILWQSTNYAQKLTAENRWDKLEIIEVPSLGDSIDTTYLQARLEDENQKKEEFFEMYCRENVPLAFLALNEGGLTNAINKITAENRGFIKFSFGEISEYNLQAEVAKRIIPGENFYIDGTSALILSEMGMLDKINKHVQGLCIPQSVITMLFKIKEKFHCLPGQTGYLGYVNGKMRFTPISPEKAEFIRSNIQNSIKFFEQNSKEISFISNANKVDCFTEQKINAELCDACIFAQNNQVPILTEDQLYLQANSVETKKNIPEYTSSYILVRELYKQNKITIDDYLEFFSYLASYRFKFLTINIDDIEHAIFGAEGARRFTPEKFKLFHPWLTLSQDYGVTFENAFFIVARIIFKALIDTSINTSDVVRLFTEMIDDFPTDKDKSTLGKMLIQVCNVPIISQQIKVDEEDVQHKVAAINKFLDEGMLESR